MKEKSFGWISLSLAMIAGAALLALVIPVVGAMFSFVFLDYFPASYGEAFLIGLAINVVVAALYFAVKVYRHMNEEAKGGSREH